MPVHRQAVRKKGRFNCCPRTTTLLRLGGGVGWFNLTKASSADQSQALQIESCDDNSK